MNHSGSYFIAATCIKSKSCKFLLDLNSDDLFATGIINFMLHIFTKIEDYIKPSIITFEIKIIFKKINYIIYKRQEFLDKEINKWSWYKDSIDLNETFDGKEYNYINTFAVLGDVNFEKFDVDSLSVTIKYKP